MKKSVALGLVVAGLSMQSHLAAQKANAPAAPMTPSQPFVRDPKIPIDEDYTKKIKEYTTEPFFGSPLSTPICYITGTIHSTETGAPTALMELAYRLVVDDHEYIKAIRNNLITLSTPVIEGRNIRAVFSCSEREASAERE